MIHSGSAYADYITSTVKHLFFAAS